MTRLPRNWLATAVACIFGLLAVFSGLDRYSEHRQGPSQFIPDAFRSGVLRAQAASSLLEDSRDAATFARKAIAADPSDVRGPSFVGGALLASGERDAAHSAFEVADQMSLREPLVQAYFFDQSLANSDYAAAAARLDILLLAHPRLASLDRLFAALEESEEGRKQIALRLADDPAWAASYLGDTEAKDEVIRSRARFLTQNATFASFDCQAVEVMLRELAGRGYRAEAQGLARAYCSSSVPAGPIADPQFEAFGEDQVFGWQRHDSGDVRISSVGSEDRAVEIENRSGVTRLVLSQPVALDEGEYRVFGSVAGGDSGRVLISLDCSEPRRPRSSGALSRGLLLRATSCHSQVLGIWLRPGTGALRLDDIRIEKVGG